MQNYWPITSLKLIIIEKYKKKKTCNYFITSTFFSIWNNIFYQNIRFFFTYFTRRTVTEKPYSGMNTSFLNFVEQINSRQFSDINCILKKKKYEYMCV